MAERITRHIVFAAIDGTWMRVGVPKIQLSYAQAVRDDLRAHGYEAEVRVYRPAVPEKEADHAQVPEPRPRDRRSVHVDRLGRALPRARPARHPHSMGRRARPRSTRDDRHRNQGRKRSMIENTKDRDPMLHLLGIMGEGQTGYIEGMESAGQAQLVASDKIPTDAPWVELEALGFVKGEVVSGDDLFTQATLPAGWKREASDHSMGSYIVDERGVRRVSIFYKAAFYDRKAHAHIISVGWGLANAIVYGEGQVELPLLWGVLTPEERGELVSGLRDQIARDSDTIERHPTLDADGSYTRHIARARQAINLAEAETTGEQK